MELRKFSRRDFLRLGGSGFEAFLVDVIPILRNIKKTVENASAPHELEFFLPKLGEMGMAVIIDKITGFSYVTPCQPEIIKDQNGNERLLLSQAHISKYEVDQNTDGAINVGLITEERERRRRSDVKDRIESHPGEEIRYVISPLVVIPEMLARGKFGTDEYKQNLLTETTYLKGIKEEITKNGLLTDITVDKDGNIGGAWAEALVITNDKTDSGEMAIQYFVKVKKPIYKDGIVTNYEEHKMLIGQNGVSHRLNLQPTPDIASGRSKPLFSLSSEGMEIDIGNEENNYLVKTILTPTPEVVPIALNVAPEVQATIDAQKASYTVNELGQPVITVKGIEITLTSITLTDAKKDFGLEILSGTRNEKNIYGKYDRYVFSKEKGDWAKYVEAGTVEKPAEISANYVDDGISKIFAALAYTEKPTMTETETKQKYEFFVFNNPSSGIGGAIQIKNGTLDFGDFDYQGVYKFLGKDGQWKYILPIVFKNPTDDNQSQLTSVFGGLTQAQFDHLTKDIKSQKTGESMLSQIINHTLKSEPWLEVPKRASGNPSDISSLYPPDTLLELFPQDEIDEITASFIKQDKTSLSYPSEVLIGIDSIPDGFSNRVVPLEFR